MDIVVIAQIIVLFISALFSIHLIFTSNGNQFLNRLLSFIFLARLIHTFYFLQPSLSNSSIEIGLSWVAKFIVLASPAIYYLYVRSFIRDDTRLKINDIVHLIPVVIALFLYSSSFLSDEIFIQEHYFDFLPGYINLISFVGIDFLAITILRSILFIAYLIFSWNLIIRAFILNYPKLDFISKGWLLVLSFIITLLQTGLFVSIYLVVFQNADASKLMSYLGIFGTAATFFLMLLIMSRPQILYGNLLRHSSSMQDFSDFSESTTITNDSSNRQHLLSEIQVKNYIQILENYIEKEEPFLNPDFNLRQLSENINIPEHHCSYLLNQIIQKNFREYINSYRIKHFISVCPSYSAQFTYEHIALKSGFKSKSTFYSAFKKETGQTPSEYFLHRSST